MKDLLLFIVAAVVGVPGILLIIAAVLLCIGCMFLVIGEGLEVLVKAPFEAWKTWTTPHLRKEKESQRIKRQYKAYLARTSDPIA